MHVWLNQMFFRKIWGCHDLIWLWQPFLQILWIYRDTYMVVINNFRNFMRLSWHVYGQAKRFFLGICESDMTRIWSWHTFFRNFMSLSWHVYGRDKQFFRNYMRLSRRVYGQAKHLFLGIYETVMTRIWSRQTFF